MSFNYFCLVDSSLCHDSIKTGPTKNPDDDDDDDGDDRGISHR